MLNSLRTRLLIWQVLLLAAVVISFGSVVFYQWRKNLIANLDAELLSTATVLEGTLRGAVPVDNSPSIDPAPQQSLPLAEDSTPRQGRVIMAGDVAPEIFDLPHSINLDADQISTTHFAIFDCNDQLIASSSEIGLQPPPVPSAHQQFRFDGPWREIVMVGPGVTRILVGRDMGDLSKRSLGFLLTLSIAGLGVLAAGSVAGYWLSGRAIEPIKKVSETVQAISGKNLERRIDTESMDSEFIQLSGMLNEMLDRLESTIEQQRRFVANASHELRTPISVIGLHSELSLSRERTPAEYQKTLQICFQASNRLRSLTDDLLVLAKSDAGELTRATEELNLCDLAAESIEFLQPLADQRQVTLASTCESNVLVHGDRRLLRQLVDNLLTNAIVHNREGGQATVAINSNQPQVTLRISDNGPGIAEKDLPRLFDRFYRVSDARTRESGGSGLGLAICQSIAHVHQGKLTVESKPGKGATFEFTLPVESAKK